MAHQNCLQSPSLLQATVFGQPFTVKDPSMLEFQQIVSPKETSACQRHSTSAARTHARTHAHTHTQLSLKLYNLGN